jgi:hypothetical protein
MDHTNCLQVAIKTLHFIWEKKVNENCGTGAGGGQSGRGMGRPKCVNAGSGCGGEADSRRKTNPEMCKKCMKTVEGRIFKSGSCGKRWAMMCANANTAVGNVLGCRGHLHKREEHRKLCARCFMDSQEGRSELQKKGLWIKKMEEDVEVTAVIKLQKRKKMMSEKVSDMIKLHIVNVCSKGSVSNVSKVM